MADLMLAAVFVLVAVGIGVAGIRLGMLLAPRIDRMIDRHDEEPGGDDD